VCICTKFGIRGRLVDVINCAEFFIDRFKGTDFVGGGGNLSISIGIEDRR